MGLLQKSTEVIKPAISSCRTSHQWHERGSFNHLLSLIVRTAAAIMCLHLKYLLVLRCRKVVR